MKASGIRPDCVLPWWIFSIFIPFLLFIFGLGLLHGCGAEHDTSQPSLALEHPTVLFLVYDATEVLLVGIQEDEFLAISGKCWSWHYTIPFRAFQKASQPCAAFSSSAKHLVQLARRIEPVVNSLIIRAAPRMAAIQ